ncbi:hypothetical protein [Pseudobutyrivibrio ruminis]|uniref:hypothetical protein n=1 Tax=Pseudobutyrivibrio ruminis TaxID=46206 RepID=UPI0018CA53BA|nr:hypothetical protein [Pseudobutyrivibrio ruminis]
MINGQDPYKIEGNQRVFPSNDEMRADRGDGRNVFGYRIDDVVAVTYKDYPFPNEVEEDFNCSFSNVGQKIV